MTNQNFTKLVKNSVSLQKVSYRAVFVNDSLYSIDKDFGDEKLTKTQLNYLLSIDDFNVEDENLLKLNYKQFKNGILK